MGPGFPFGGDENVLKLIWLHNSQHTENIELCTLNGPVLDMRIILQESCCLKMPWQKSEIEEERGAEGL